MLTRGHLTMSGDIFGCYNYTEETSGIQWVEPGTLMHSLQYTGQSQQEVIWPKMSEVPVKKLWSKHTCICHIQATRTYDNLTPCLVCQSQCG